MICLRYVLANALDWSICMRYVFPLVGLPNLSILYEFGDFADIHLSICFYSLGLRFVYVMYLVGLWSLLSVGIVKICMKNYLGRAQQNVKVNTVFICFS